MIIEYTHRLLAGSLAVVIASLAVLAWRRYRHRPAVFRLSVAAFALVVFQAALGGLTVEKGLKEELVATHLGIAMLQLSLLLALSYVSRPARAGPAEASFAPVRSGVRVLAIASTLVVLATIVAGGYMSANELHGTGKAERSVHTACGRDFPSCGGAFLPFGRSRELDIHLTHRAFVYLASMLVLALFVTVLWQERVTPRPGRPLSRAASAAFGILLLQVLLGALNVWLGEHPWLVIAHLAAATALWSSLVYLSLLVLRAPRRAAVASPREAKVEAAPA
jgi:heme A synthase